MARAPFTYPFCYTPAPDIVDAANRLIACLDAGGFSADSGVAPENRSHPRLRKREGPAELWTEGASALADLRSKCSGRGPAQPDVFGGKLPNGDPPALREGKMLGVLKVEDEQGREDYLYAFSGTVGGRATLPGFVPPIYDLTAPEGYFRQREAEISAMPAGPERAAASAELQAWIFDQYRVSNARGQTLTIREVFARRGLVPPGGTGDCAAPKLLQYAYIHHLTPIAMGEFWYGAAPASEVREQGRFYPSCTGKCGPLLSFMLEGLEVEPNPLDREFTTDREPEMLYADDSILVVCKPAGMLSVPGRTRAKSLLDWLREHETDLAILDINMPKADGFAVLDHLRRSGQKTPVLFLTARDSITDRVRGLDAGANDYLVKPFSLEELMARVRVLTRSAHGSIDNVLTAADLTLNIASHEVRRAGERIELSAKEYQLLEYLMYNKGIVLSREKIENHIWNFDYEGGTNVVDVYISYLRKKIDGKNAVRLIRTVRGVGYVLKDEP